MAGNYNELTESAKLAKQIAKLSGHKSTGAYVHRSGDDEYGVKIHDLGNGKVRTSDKDVISGAGRPTIKDHDSIEDAAKHIKGMLKEENYEEEYELDEVSKSKAGKTIFGRAAKGIDAENAGDEENAEKNFNKFAKSKERFGKKYGAKAFDKMTNAVGNRFNAEEYDLEEDTMASSSLKPGARKISDPKSLDNSKIGMMSRMMHTMNSMEKSDMVDFFNQVMGQFGPGKDYGVGDKSGSNQSSIDMSPSHASKTTGPKTRDAMPKLNVKEDVEEMFAGEELSEDFKEKASTLFEAAINARLIAEMARLEEEYEDAISEELENFNENITNKLDSYLDYVVEQWMEENEVAIESTLRNELAEEFMEGLKNLFAENYISVPQEQVDVLEALADKVNALEDKLDESITENTELKGYLLETKKEEILEEIASDLALTQQDKFNALVEGIEFDGDLETYARKVMIIKENYFRTETTYSSNIEEETFEGDLYESTGSKYVDPNVNRYVQAISKTVKN